MEEWMEVKSKAVWDESRDGWVVETEYLADNFIDGVPLREKYLVKAGNENVIPLAIQATLGLIPDTCGDESVEGIL